MVRVTKLELHRTISDIMKKGDLDQLTTKKIRILCEQKYNVDLTSRKEEIDRIVMAFVTKQSGNHQNVGKKAEKESSGESDSDDTEENSSGSSGSSGEESCSDSECAPATAAASKKSANQVQVAAPKKSPAKKVLPSVPDKKAKTKPTKKAAAIKAPAKKMKTATASKQAELDDAAYARQLQAEEWNFRQRTVKKLFRDIPNKKNNTNEQIKRRKASPFLKKCLLSPALAEVIGTDEMSRPDVVQKMWSVVRERNLFDTSNKQYALCDEQLLKIFGKKRVRLIGMMKYLKNHIKDIH